MNSIIVNGQYRKYTKIGKELDMSLIKLVEDIKLLKYILKDEDKNSGYGLDDIIDECIIEIEKHLPCPEILAFAEAMEAGMWKWGNVPNSRQVDKTELELGAEQALIDEEYLSLAIYTMELWWRAKDASDEKDN